MLICRTLWQSIGSLVETSCIMNCLGIHIWIAPTSNMNTENCIYSKPSLFSKTGAKRSLIQTWKVLQGSINEIIGASQNDEILLSGLSK